MHKKLKLLSGGCVALFVYACATSSQVEPEAPTPEAPTTTPIAEAAPTKPAPIPETDDTCGAAALKILIGKSIAAVQMPADKNIRVIGANTQVTQDHRPERMNIEVDEVAKIKDIYCG